MKPLQRPRAAFRSWRRRASWRDPAAFARLALIITLALLWVDMPVGLAQTTTSSPQTRTVSGSRKTEAGAKKTEELSDAERVVRLQRTIEDSRRQLEELRGKLKDPNSEYAKAEAEFSQLDLALSDKKKALEEHEKAARAEKAAAVAAEIEELNIKHGLARKRFDLAIQERKTLQEQIATLEQRIEQDTQALQSLKGEARTATSQPANAPPAAVATAPAPVTPAVAVPPGATPAPPPVLSPPAAATSAEKPPNPALLKARAEADRKQAVAQEAQQQVASILERIEALQKSIQLEDRLLETARQQADNAQETERALYDEIQRKWQDGLPHSQLQGLYTKLSEARSRLRSARAESRDHTDQLARLRTEMNTLQAEQITALEKSQQKQSEAETARKQVKRLENPFSPHNLLQWCLQHGPAILAILLTMIGVLWLARVLENRIIKLMARHGERGSLTERENRARTLVSVFHNAIRVMVIPGGLFMILAEAGVNIIPLMGGAAVVGLAVAFGAQNLIRDYFTGFMILLENQYGINDVVTIAGISGTVERVTMRMTVLRDLEGVVHFIPNGHITTVSNKTHGWSRALFDVGVAYRHDPDEVIAVLKQIGVELRRDSDFQDAILEDPEMLGVEQLGDSAVSIRFYMTTRAQMQWPVRREMLRRIKKRFDELGIEIPFPQRVVHFRNEAGRGGDEVAAEALSSDRRANGARTLTC